MATQQEDQVELPHREAFEDFYRREHPGQLRRAVLLLGSEADANDAVAHAFSKILERWAELENPGAYLNRSVLNACRDIGRSRRRLSVVGEHGARVAEDEHRPSMAILEALLALPYKQRAVVVLRHYVGLSEREIADQLGIASGSVGPTLFRAHSKLKSTLKEFAP